MDCGICANLQMFSNKVPHRQCLPFQVNYPRYYGGFPQTLNPWIPSLYPVTQTGHPYPNLYPLYRLQGNVPSQLTPYVGQTTKNSTCTGHGKISSTVEPPKNLSNLPAVSSGHSTSNVQGKLISPKKESISPVKEKTPSQATSNVQGKLLSPKKESRSPVIKDTFAQSASNVQRKALFAEDQSTKESNRVVTAIPAVSLGQSTSTVKQRPILPKAQYHAVYLSQSTSSFQGKSLLTDNSLKRLKRPRKPYTKVTPDIKKALLQAYKTNPYITGEAKRKLANQVGESVVFVEKWFANRRHTNVNKMKKVARAGIVKMEILDY